MKITPVSSPHQIQDTNSSKASSDARARAVAALLGDAAAPVSQNSIAPEEMSAIEPQHAEQPQHIAQVEEQTQVPKDTVQEGMNEPASAEPNIEENTNYSSQLAQLARKEKAMRAKIQAQEAQLAQREAELKQREQELSTRDSKYQTEYVSKEQLRTDAFRLLAEAGVDVTALAEQMLSQPQLDPRIEAKIASLHAQIEKLQKANEEAAKRAQEQQDEAYKAAIRQITQDATALVRDSDEYEMIRATNSVKDVVELIEATFKEEGRVMTVEEAAQEVEEYLVAEAEKLAKTKKIQSRLAPKPQTPEVKPEVQAQPAQQQQPMRTLTNANSSTRKLSARERAILAMEGKTRS